MKKNFLFITLLISLFLITSCPMEVEQNNSGGFPEVIIVWENSEFFGAARTALKKPDGDIMPSDVASITTLDLSGTPSTILGPGRTLTAIGDIKYFTGLTSLNLSNNEIEDIRALSGLTKLTILDLSNNKIKDISVLAGMTSKLDTLRLENNNISDISTLRGLKNSAKLDLSGNDIADADANWVSVGNVVDVKGRPEKIDWQNSKIEEAVRGEINKPSGDILTTEVARLSTLNLSGKNITNLDDIKHFTGLTNLNLGNNQISDITALENLTKLTTLDLTENPNIETWNWQKWLPIAHVHNVNNRPPHITWKDISFGNAVRTIINRPSGIILETEVATIGSMDLSGKNISIIDDIKYFTALTSINLSNNYIFDISPLSTFSNFSNLTNLDLRYNQLSDISAFAGLINSVGTVDLRFNDGITDWTPVPKSNITTVLGRPTYVWDTSVPPLLVDDIHQISSAEDLAWMAAQGFKTNFAGKTFKFMNDIDMKNQEFSGISAFAGIMDGNNKKITNLRISRSSDTYVGLVRYLESGEIKNLIIESGTITGNDHVGAFVGVARISNNPSNPPDRIPILSGLVNKASVTGVDIVGGIIGASPDTPIIDGTYPNSTISASPNMTITNVQNFGNITGTEINIGGIIGRATFASVTDATNAGAVLGKGRIGGIIGWTDGTVTIANPINNGSVSASGNVATAGGIIGEASYGNRTLISNANNTGNITANGYIARVGGIIGIADSSGVGGLKIENATNSGTVTALNITANEQTTVAGGIIGWADGSGGGLSIENATNTGEINSEISGNIVGYKINEVTITNTR